MESYKKVTNDVPRITLRVHEILLNEFQAVTLQMLFTYLCIYSLFGNSVSNAN